MNRLEIDVYSIDCNNNRKEGGLEKIDELAASILEFGLVSAITVVATPTAEKPYRIIAGRRRVAAFKLLDEQHKDCGWDEIRADVLDASELGADEESLALVENTAREDMNPLDEGAVFQKMLEAGKSAEEIGVIFCRSKSQVYQRAKLGRLVPVLKDFVREKRLSFSDAARLSELDEETQEACAGQLGRGTSAIPTTLSKWQVDDAIRMNSKCVIGAKFTCEACASCPKRTHYGDETLFPELGNSADYCLDTECYMRRWKERLEDGIQAALDAHEKEGGASAEAVILLPYSGEFPGLGVVKKETVAVLGGKEYRLVPRSDAETGVAQRYESAGIVVHWVAQRYESAGIAVHWGIDMGFSAPKVNDFVYKRDMAEIDRAIKEKEAAERNKERACAHDEFFSTLPEPVRKERDVNSVQDHGKLRSALRRIAYRTVYEAAEKNKYFQRYLFSDLLSGALLDLSDELDVQDIDNLVLPDDISADYIVKLSEVQFMELVRLVSYLYAIKDLYPSSLQDISATDFGKLMARFTGAALDSKDFRDGCVREAFKEEVAAFTQSAAERMEAPDEPEADDEPMDDEAEGDIIPEGDTDEGTAAPAPLPPSPFSEREVNAAAMEFFAENHNRIPFIIGITGDLSLFPESMREGDLVSIMDGTGKPMQMRFFEFPDDEYDVTKHPVADGLGNWEPYVVLNDWVSGLENKVHRAEFSTVYVRNKRFADGKAEITEEQDVDDEAEGGIIPKCLTDFSQIVEGELTRENAGKN